MDLDVFSLCTPDLQGRLEPAREHLRKKEEMESAAKKQRTEVIQEDKRSQREIMQALNVDKALADDVGANVSGQYDLVAVLTHVGRSTDSGHYIAWTRDVAADQWCM